jgi:hypothetical protein
MADDRDCRRNDFRCGMDVSKKDSVILQSLRTHRDIQTCAQYQEDKDTFARGRIWRESFVQYVFAPAIAWKLCLRATASI